MTPAWPCLRLIRSPYRADVDPQAFSGLMAQVIPVVLLAAMAELAGLHGIYRDFVPARTSGSKSRQSRTAAASGQHTPNLDAMRRLLPWTLLMQYTFLAALMLLEIAAIAVAGRAEPGVVAGILMRPTVVGAIVGTGFLLTLLFGLMAVGHAYRAIGLLSDEGYLAVRLGVTLTLGACLVAGLTFF